MTLIARKDIKVNYETFLDLKSISSELKKIISAIKLNWIKRLSNSVVGKAAINNGLAK